MVEKTLTPKKIKPTSTNILVYDLDETDAINTTGVDVDDGNYDNGTFKDRDYDVREYKSLAINLENIGNNDVKYKILSAEKDFTDLDADLGDDDFDKEEKAETTLAKRAKATGSVEVTGGPSTKADGTLTCTSVVANTFADGDIVCASVEVGDTVTFNGLLYTAVDGTPAEDEFDQSGTNDQCATSLAAQITADTRSGTSGDQTATSSTDTVTGTTDVLGTAGNAITLISSNGTRLAVTGSGFLTGGINADTATANGNKYTAVDGTKSNDTEFDMSGTDDQTATDLADSIDDDTRPGITVPTIDVSATATTNVVTVSAPLNDGADGNAIDIAGTSNIAADNATLTGGITSTMNGITVDGQEIMDGVAVRWRTSDSLTALDIAANINGITTSPNYSATESAGVVTITAIVNEPSTDAVVSSTTVMTKSDTNMSGGAGGKAASLEIIRNSPTITAIRIRAKEASGGSPGKIRADIKASRT